MKKIVVIISVALGLIVFFLLKSAWRSAIGGTGLTPPAPSLFGPVSQEKAPAAMPEHIPANGLKKINTAFPPYMQARQSKAFSIVQIGCGNWMGREAMLQVAALLLADREQCDAWLRDNFQYERISGGAIKAFIPAPPREFSKEMDANFKKELEELLGANDAVRCFKAIEKERDYYLVNGRGEKRLIIRSLDSGPLNSDTERFEVEADISFPYKTWNFPVKIDAISFYQKWTGSPNEGEYSYLRDIF